MALLITEEKGIIEISWPVRYCPNCGTDIDFRLFSENANAKGNDITVDCRNCFYFGPLMDEYGKCPICHKPHYPHTDPVKEYLEFMNPARIR